MTGFGFVSCRMFYLSQNGTPYGVESAGRYLTAGAIEGLRVLMGSGTLSGNFLHLGLTKA